MTAPRILSHEAFRREAKAAIESFQKLGGPSPLSDIELGAVQIVLNLLETKLLCQGFLGPELVADEGSVQTSNQGPKSFPEWQKPFSGGWPEASS